MRKCEGKFEMRNAKNGNAKGNAKCGNANHDGILMTGFAQTTTGTFRISKFEFRISFPHFLSLLYSGVGCGQHGSILAIRILSDQLHHEVIGIQLACDDFEVLPSPAFGGKASLQIDGLPVV